MLSFALPRFKRSVHLLFVCQALADTGMSLVTTTTALAALTIADDPALFIAGGAIVRLALRSPCMAG